jgi:hypothetical protein
MSKSGRWERWIEVSRFGVKRRKMPPHTFLGRFEKPREKALGELECL